jgi:DNA-binding XRE family transcriptional regulator
VPARSSPDRSHGPSEVWSRPAIKRAITKAGKALGLRLRKLREERGLTQEAAAERAALHAKYLGVIEGGKANATLGTLVALAYAYEVSLSAFFEGTPVVKAAARGGRGTGTE